MNRFGVSRTVARETVQALAMLGLVRVQHGKRTEVLPGRGWDILSSVVQEALRREGKAEPLLRDLYEFRLLIEPQAAALDGGARKRRRPPTAEDLAGEMERLARARRPSPDAVLAADRSFHDLVARASENRVVHAVSRDIREVISTLWGFSHLGHEEARSVARQHRRIADAVVQRDADAAAETMRDHLEWAAQADLRRARRHHDPASSVTSVEAEG